MKKSIQNIRIIGTIKDTLNDNVDIEVDLDDATVYTATFFTVTNIIYLMNNYKYFTGDCNNGKYFWASDMCIVDILEYSRIEETIISIFNEGLLEQIFRRIK